MISGPVALPSGGAFVRLESRILEGGPGAFRADSDRTQAFAEPSAFRNAASPAAEICTHCGSGVVPPS